MEKGGETSLHIQRYKAPTDYVRGNDTGLGLSGPQRQSPARGPFLSEPTVEFLAVW